MKLPLLTLVFTTLLLSACSRPLPTHYEATRLIPESTALVMESAEVTEAKTTEQLLAELDLVRQRAVPEFRLGKGDLLTVSVYGEADLSVDSLPVRTDGKISFPLIGDVVAEGLLVEELRDEITRLLSVYLREPRVAVIVRQFASLKYTLAGEVAKPGVYPLTTEVWLTEAIAQAGGFAKGNFHATSIEIADLTHAYISRDGEYLPVDFVQLFRNADLRFNLLLAPGDYIYIPSGLTKEIYILGEVGRADIFAFNEGFTAVNAISQANGFTPDADLSRIHIVRGSLTNPQLYILDLEAVLSGKQQDIVLKAGDIIYVPPSGLTEWNRVLSKLIPSIQAVQTGLILDRTFRN